MNRASFTPVQCIDIPKDRNYQSAKVDTVLPLDLHPAVMLTLRTLEGKELTIFLSEDGASEIADMIVFIQDQTRKLRGRAAGK